MKKSWINLLFIPMFLMLSAISCKKPITPENKDVDYKEKKFINEIMADYYYWNNYIPKEIKSEGLTIFDHFDMMLYSKDRWSWMMTGQEYNESETGVYSSYGAYLSQAIEFYNDYNVRVAYVHPNSPFDKAGVSRGWIISHINGNTVASLINNGTFNSVYANTSNNFTFVTPTGESVDKSITAATISTKSVLRATVLTAEDYPGLPHPVGYFHYLTFNANMINQITEAMEMFREAGIKDMIVDLRYNGGGDVRAQEALANFIAPESANEKILAKRKHNDVLGPYYDNDTETMSYIRNEGLSLGLERVFFITGKGSASASEVIINGLKPLMEVIHVGSTTYGKPYGMYVIGYPNVTDPTYVFLPICFATVNSRGEGDFIDGIDPQYKVADDLYSDFGADEARIKYCLSMIVTGQGTQPQIYPRAKTTSTGYRMPQEYDKPGYGRYIVNLP